MLIGVIFVTSLIEYYLFALLLKIDINKNIQQMIFGYSITLAILIITNQVIDVFFEPLIYFCLFSLIGKLVYRVKFNKSMVASLFLVIIIAVSKIVYLITIKCFQVAIDNYNVLHILETNFSDKVISNLIMLILMCVTFLRRIVIDCIDSISNQKVLFIIGFNFLILSYIYLATYQLNEELELSTELILSVTIVVYFAISILFLFNENIQKYKILSQYDQLLKYVAIQENCLEEQYISQHEYQNQLITLLSMVDKESQSAEYIQNILSDTNHIKNNHTIIKRVEQNGLKGLLIYKIAEAKEKQIEVTVDISEEIESLNLNEIKMQLIKNTCRLLGIYIDNAIEACEKSVEKNIGIEIYIKDQEIWVTISNTYAGLIELDKIGNNSYSTKGSGRGHGLTLANRIINENSCFNQMKELVGHYYIQHFMVDITN